MNHHLEHLNILLVDCKTGSRSQLREILKSVVYKLKLVSAPSFPAGIKALKENEERFDVLLVGSHESKEDLINFVHSLRSEAQDLKAPLILALHSEHQDTTYIADIYLEGVQGFLCEPYSADELARLLVTVQEGPAEEEVEDKDKKCKTADFLLSSAVTLIDKMCLQMINGKERSGVTMKSLRGISQSLSRVTEDLAEEYGDILYLRMRRSKPSGRVPRAERTVVREKVVHPGILAHQLFLKRELSAEKVIPIIRLSEEELQELFVGEMEVDEPVAEALSRVFGQNAKYWLDMQKSFSASVQNSQ
jgi:plasmid maintenance system antidote protein VapI/CheY-like chemotaxis protein